jgi:transglutaminase-like putative cysteine protease
MLLKVDHLTRYFYDQPVRGVVQSHRLVPSVFDGQKTLTWGVSVSDGIRGGSFRDGAGDAVQSWSVLGPVSEITVHVTGEVETTDLAGLLRGHRERTPPEAYLRDTMPTRVDAALAGLADGLDVTHDMLGAAHVLSARVSDAIVYRTGTTTAKTTASEAIAFGEGVCQDQSHAMIAVARHMGIPARYISGYLHMTGDVVTEEAAHAWAELHIAGLGWVGFDPANRCCPDARYIRLGSGLDAQDAAPIRGTARGLGVESLEVTVSITAPQASQQQSQSL